MGKFTNVMVAGALAVLAFSSCAEEKKGYVIDGQITDVKDGMMYLKKYVDKTFVEVDSAVIVDGKFGWWCESDECKIFGEKIEMISHEELLEVSNNSFDFLQQNYLTSKIFKLIL